MNLEELERLPVSNGVWYRNRDAILTRLRALEEWYEAEREYERAWKVFGIETSMVRLDAAEAALIAAMEAQGD